MSIQVNGIQPIAGTETRGDTPRVSPFPAPSQAQAAGRQTAVPQMSLGEAAAALNQHFSGVRTDIRFSVVQDLGKPMIALMDANGAVIWQVPDEQALRAAREISRTQHLLQAEA
jgi:uncharacterized FlaG/YvyC family protein